nr:MAG TPA: hypothetical protein [Caudoviricetes sp.]
MVQLVHFLIVLPKNYLLRMHLVFSKLRLSKFFL